MFVVKPHDLRRHISDYLEKTMERRCVRLKREQGVMLQDNLQRTLCPEV